MDAEEEQARAIERLRAIAHPLRLRLLSLLTGTAASAAEVARELGVSQANASYHLRLLERAGLVRVTEEVKVRGGTARRYRHESSSEPFTEVDPAQRTTDAVARARFVSAMIGELRRRSVFRGEGPSISIDAELWVDPEVWRRVVSQVGEASALLHASAAPPRTEGTLHATMSAALFTMTSG